MGADAEHLIFFFLTGPTAQKLAGGIVETRGWITNAYHRLSFLSILKWAALSIPFRHFHLPLLGEVTFNLQIFHGILNFFFVIKDYKH